MKENVKLFQIDNTLNPYCLLFNSLIIILKPES